MCYLCQCFNPALRPNRQEDLMECMAQVVSCKNQNSSYRGRFFLKGKLNLVQVKGAEGEGGGIRVIRVRVTRVLLIFTSGEKFYMCENQEILK